MMRRPRVFSSSAVSNGDSLICRRYSCKPDRTAAEAMGAPSLWNSDPQTAQAAHTFSASLHTGSIGSGRRALSDGQYRALDLYTTCAVRPVPDVGDGMGTPMH